MYLGLYVDDFVYFSKDETVERAFEAKLGALTTVDFMGQVTFFLGIKFSWRTTQQTVSVHLSQRAFVESLLHQFDFPSESTSFKPTPYRSGHPVDSIPDSDISTQQRSILETILRRLVGSFNWMLQATRPDLTTITSILAKFQHSPSPGHIGAARHVLKYLNGTKDLGISFHSNKYFNIQSFVNFPIRGDIKLSAACDANWGPQDQSTPKTLPRPELDLFKTQSISGHLLAFHGPLHWTSKRQNITARSSAEAEIYATDKCVRDIQFVSNIIKDLRLQHELLNQPVCIYNDNMACVLWSKAKTTKNLRHIQINENAVRESIQNKEVEIFHIPGNENLSDIFTKEDRDQHHFLRLRNIVMSPPFPEIHQKVS